MVDAFRLHEMCPNVTVPSAHAWLQRCKGDVGLAWERLEGTKRVRAADLVSLQVLEAALARQTSNELMRAVLVASDAVRATETRCLLCNAALDERSAFPIPCGREICVFAHRAFKFAPFGACVVTKTIWKPPEVGRFLLELYVDAVNNNRFFEHCKPCDTIEVTHDQLRETVQALPAWEDIEHCVRHGNLRQRLKSADMRLPDIVDWVLQTNQSYIRRLEPNERVRCGEPDMLESSVQYHTLGASLDHTERFQQLKDQHGTFWAFHGSPHHCWHSILRQGLQNYSGSKFMTTGSAHGKGVYLSDSLQFSAGYAKRNKDGQFIVGLCEVVRHPAFPSRSTTGLHVIPNPDCVSIRYLLVLNTLPTGCVRATEIKTHSSSC